MIVTALKTPRIGVGEYTLEQFLDAFLPEAHEKSVVAITSKVVSLCEQAVVPLESITKEKLVTQEADQYVLLPKNEYGVVFTVIRNTLLPNAGVDESNAEGVYVLWPRDPQATANQVRAYLCRRFNLQQVGVIITDSTARPLRWGMGGIAIAHSGFKELRDYRGEPDLYGRKFVVETNSITGGLASAATLVMGEGAESQPIALLEDLPFVEFQDHDPTQAELDANKIEVTNDLYAPILQAVQWLPGGRQATAHG